MKKVGLVLAKGEGGRIEYCLRALARSVDEIVYFDDNSPDDTLEHVYRIQNECRVTRIIESHLTDHNEGRDRNLLLEAGREIGGECFLVLDADEAFAANAADYVQMALDSLTPGEALQVPWTHVWRNARQYRADPCPWVGNWRTVAFCDDGKSAYSDKYLHVERVPLEVKHYRLPGEIVFLHFQFICWPNVIIKQVWYEMLERLYSQQSVEALNHAYALALDERGIKLLPTNAKWFYPFFDERAFMTFCAWRVAQMREWKAADPERFKGLLPCPYVDQTSLAAVV